MEVRQEAGAAAVLDPEIKMEEEEEEEEEEGAVDPEEGEPKEGTALPRTAGSQAKEEPEDETPGNWDARLQEYLKMLQALLPSAGKTSQQPERKPCRGPKRSSVPSQGTRGANKEPKGLWVSPKELPLPGDAGQEPSAHLDAASLGKERARGLPASPAKAEMQRQRFRMFRYEDARGPREVCQQLRERCHEWLEPEKHSKEQMLELVTLEQFLAVLPPEVQGWVEGRGPGSCTQAVTLAEEFLRRQPEAKVRELQVTGLNEEHGAVSPAAREALPNQEKSRLPTEKEDGRKGNARMPAQDRHLREKEERRPLVDIPEGDFWSQGETEENQSKAKGSKGEAGATGLDRPGQPQGEGVTRPATQEEEEEEEENWVKDDPSGEDPPLMAPEDLEGEEKPFRCWHCGKSFSSSVKLVTHERTHVREYLYTCASCGESERTHTDQKPHKCSHCGNTFGWSPRERPYTCSECGKSCSYRSDLRKHQRTHTGEKPYSCSACGKNFRNGSGLKVHQRIHTTVCSFCGRSFGQKAELAAHEETHAASDAFSCFTCPKSFRNIPNLKSHERTHTGEKPYQCSHCEKSFRWSSRLVLHERIHTGEKPYRCVDCGRTFSRRSSLLVHTRIHTGQRPYICSACGKSFASNSVLLRHLKTHAGEEVCPCSQCGKTFRQRLGRAQRASQCSECLSSCSRDSDLLANVRIPAEEK